MRNTLLAVLLAAAGSIALWSLATSAQVIDADPCQRACYQAHAACVTGCGTQNDPIECEGDCQDQVEDCLSECR